MDLGKITELGSKEGDRTVKLRFDDASQSFILSSKGNSVAKTQQNFIPLISNNQKNASYQLHIYFSKI